jgi:DNA-binding LytR/AlgR family response regulator
MSLRILILEDEAPAVAQLERMLHRWDPTTVVAGAVESVRDAIGWLRAHPEPDLVVADIRLSDGLSLRVFDEVRVGCPVIFTTAHDDYVMKALERNAIDYLVKPIEAPRLTLARDKYLRLREHFGGRLADLARDLGRGASEPTRVLARRGASYVAVPLERIAWFTTEHKQTVLVERRGTRLLVDEGLSDLESRLGARVFRLNRQYLACADAIVDFASMGRGRLRVTLEPRTDDDVVVSQESGAAFRAWIAR